MKPVRISIPSFFPALLLTATLMLLGACAGSDDGERVGRAMGTAAGAVIAADAAKDSPPAVRAAVTVLGAFIGSWIGGEIGKQLDQDFAERALEDGLESKPDGESVIWSNPDSGNSGSATPVSTEKTADGTDCRDFESTILIDGREEKTSGRACRQPDGSWQVVASGGTSL